MTTHDMSPQRHGMSGEEWNRRYPVGTPVRYWPAAREGAGRESVTRTPAWTLGNGDTVVSIEGHAGGIALTHVSPVETTTGDELRHSINMALSNTRFHSRSEQIDAVLTALDSGNPVPASPQDRDAAIVETPGQWVDLFLAEPRHRQVAVASNAMDAADRAETAEAKLHAVDKARNAARDQLTEPINQYGQAAGTAPRWCSPASTAPWTVSVMHSQCCPRQQRVASGARQRRDSARGRVERRGQGRVPRMPRSSRVPRLRARQ